MKTGLGTWWSRDISSCKNGVDGRAAGEENGEYTRAEAACLGSGCLLVSIKRLDKRAFL